MKNVFKEWNFKKHTIASIIIVLISLAVSLFALINGHYRAMQGTVGIIGGADGPTAIFLASSSSSKLTDILLNPFSLFLAVLLLAYIPLKKLIKK